MSRKIFSAFAACALLAAGSAVIAQPSYVDLIQPADVYAGNYSMRITYQNPFVGGHDHAISKDSNVDGIRIPVTAGEDYTVSVWAKGGGAGQNLALRIAAFTDSATPGGGSSFVGDIPSGGPQVIGLTETYAEYTFGFTVPSGADEIAIRIGCFNDNGGIVFIDDITLNNDTQGTPVTVENGDFEQWEPTVFPADGTDVDADDGTGPTAWRVFAVGGAQIEYARIGTGTSVPEFYLYH